MPRPSPRRLRIANEAEGVEIPLDDRTFGGVSTMTFITRFGPLDILFEPSGAPAFAELRSHAEVLERFGLEIPVASAEDLVSMKRASGREKDIGHLTALVDFIAERNRR